MNNEKDSVISEGSVNGVLTSRYVTDQGIHRSILGKLVASGTYYRVKRGIYVQTDAWEDELYILQQKYRRGIYSHVTALYLYGYSDRVPIYYQMTFPKGYNCASLKEENIRIVRVNPENYALGIREIATPAGNKVAVYDLERCLCDMLRGKGDDIQIVHAAMKKYAASKDRDINKLMMYAKQLKVEAKVRKYMEVLL